MDLAGAEEVFVTRSRKGDLILFFSVLALGLLLCSRLRVYFRVTVAELSVERVSPDGHRVTLPTPPAFLRPGNGHWRGDVLMATLEPRIRAYMSSSIWLSEAAPGTRFIWTTRWADDSPRLTHVGYVTVEVPDAATKP